MAKGIILKLWMSFLVTIIAVITYFFSIKANILNLFGGMPSFDLLENPELEFSSSLYSADGELLGEYFSINRRSLRYEDISVNVINALIATEDIRFYQHSGIDTKAITRAIVFSVLLNKNKGGGSTLSQQLAKNLFKTRTDLHKNFFNIGVLNMLISKTKEWILAVQIERCYTKEEIITMYLNTVSFGSNTFGLKAAAEAFFDVSPSDLSIDQASLLIGILKAPTRYSPLRKQDNAIKRRNVVLKQMNSNGFISDDEYDELKRKPIQLKYVAKDHHNGIAPYFRAVAKNFLMKWASENGYNLFSSGLKIYTTIDSRLQRHAEEAVKNKMTLLQDKFYKHWDDKNPWVDDQGKEIKNFIETKCIESPFYRKLKEEGLDHGSIMEVMNTPVPMKLFSWEGEIDTVISHIEAIKYNKKILHTGLLSVDPQSHHIKAWVGGINHKFFEYDHVKQGKRQPGSTFKPFVYVVALDNGYSPLDKISDVPVTFKLSARKVWTPENWNKQYSGKKITLRDAVRQSINSVTAYLTKQLSPELIVEYAKRLGIESELEAVPSLGLGVCDVSLYELVGAYNTFLNKGRYADFIFISRIEDQYGNILADFTSQTRDAISEKTAYTMIEMLKNNNHFLLNKTIAQDNDVAFKTGTTSNHSDGWFIGMTHNLLTGIWVGGDNRCIHFRTMREGSGANTAMPIWREFMTNVYKDEDLKLVYPKGLFNTPLQYKIVDNDVKNDSNTDDSETSSDQTAVDQQSSDYEEECIY